MSSCIIKIIFLFYTATTMVPMTPPIDDDSEDGVNGDIIKVSP